MENIKTLGITGWRGVLGHCIRDVVANTAEDSFRLCLFQGDISNEDDVNTWVAENEFNALIHLAAVSSVDGVNRDVSRCWQVNVLGSVNLGFSIARLKPNIQLIFASTSHVYQPSAYPLNEESILSPSDLYGLSKLHAEQVLQRLSHRYGFPLTIARIFSFTSPYQNPPFFIPTVVENLLEVRAGDKLTFGSLEGERDFLDGHDVARALLLLANRQVSGVVNVCSGRKYDLRRIVDYCMDRLGRQGIEIQESRSANDKRVVLWGDNARLKELGFEPVLQTIEEIIDKFISGRKSSSVVV